MAGALMKAAVCKELGKPLVVADVPIPEPTGRLILVRVKAAALCHSDLSIVGGGFGPIPVPVIPGHEAVSVVEKLGPEASAYGIKIGDLIGAPLWQNMCLECHDCREAGAQFCPKMQIKGLTCPGYFAEYTLVDPASAVVIPPSSVDQPAKLAPLFCAGITIWDALERADVKLGETIAIVGVGGLGQIATQYAHELGHKVIAMDVNDKQLTACKADGSANHIINTSGLDPEALAGAVLEANSGKMVDVVIVCSGVTPAYNTALAISKAGGRVIAVGLPHDPVPLPIPVLTGRGIQVEGAKVPGQPGAQKCLDFVLRRRLALKVHPRKFKLEEINEMLDLMKAGKVDEGRMIIEF